MDTNQEPKVATKKVAKVKPVEPKVEPVSAPELIPYVNLDHHFGGKPGVVVTDRYLIEYRKLPSVPEVVTWHVRVCFPEDTEMERPVYVRTVSCGPNETFSFGPLF